MNQQSGRSFSMFSRPRGGGFLPIYCQRKKWDEFDGLTEERPACNQQDAMFTALGNNLSPGENNAGLCLHDCPFAAFWKEGICCHIPLFFVFFKTTQSKIQTLLFHSACWPWSDDMSEEIN